MSKPKVLYGVELDIGREASKPHHWVLHREIDTDGYENLFVFETKKKALEETKGRDHPARVVRFIRSRWKNDDAILDAIARMHRLGKIAGREERRKAYRSSKSLRAKQKCKVKDLKAVTKTSKQAKNTSRKDRKVVFN